MRFELNKKGNNVLELSVVETGKFDTYVLEYDQINKLHENFKHNNDSERSIEVKSIDQYNRDITLIFRTDYSGMCIVIYDIAVNNVRYFRLSKIEENTVYSYVSDIVMIHEIEERREHDLLRVRYENLILNVEDAEEYNEEEDRNEVEEVEVVEDPAMTLIKTVNAFPETTKDPRRKTAKFDDFYIDDAIIWAHIIDSRILMKPKFLSKILTGAITVSSFNYYYSRYASKSKNNLSTAKCKEIISIIQCIYKYMNSDGEECDCTHCSKGCPTKNIMIMQAVSSQILGTSWQLK